MRFQGGGVGHRGMHYTQLCDHTGAASHAEPEEELEEDEPQATQAPAGDDPEGEDSDVLEEPEDGDHDGNGGQAIAGGDESDLDDDPEDGEADLFDAQEMEGFADL